MHCCLRDRSVKVLAKDAVHEFGRNPENSSVNETENKDHARYGNLERALVERTLDTGSDSLSSIVSCTVIDHS